MLNESGEVTLYSELQPSVSTDTALYELLPEEDYVLLVFDADQRTTSVAFKVSNNVYAVKVDYLASDVSAEPLVSGVPSRETVTAN